MITLNSPAMRCRQVNCQIVTKLRGVRSFAVGTVAVSLQECDMVHGKAFQLISVMQFPRSCEEITSTSCQYIYFLEASMTLILATSIAVLMECKRRSRLLETHCHV